MGVVPGIADSDIAALREQHAECGRSVAGLVLAWQDANHRKVEAIALREGDRARRKISLDLTPAHIPWPPRGAATPDGDVRQIVVPLTFVAKGPMRSLDVIDDGGRTVPVLGRRDNGLVSTAALVAVVAAEAGSDSGRDLDDELWKTLYTIACGEPDDAKVAAQRLIESLSLDSLAANFVRDLAANFLLCVLLPVAAGNVRQVVKFSYQWERARRGDVEPQTRWGRLEVVGAGVGLTSYAIQVDMGSPSSTASYHLEVPAPEGLVSTSLSMPPGIAGMPADVQVSPFGHAFDTYATDPSEDALVQLEVSGHGLHPIVTGACVGTFTVFLLALTLDGALDTLRLSGGGANGLLLFGPALLLAVAGGRRESSLVSRVLRPLRAISLAMSGALFVAGASLVGKLRHPWITALWVTCAVLSGVAAIVLVGATVRLRKRGG